MIDVDRSDPARGVPARLVTRLSNELHLSGLCELLRLGCGPFDAGVVVLVLLRVCLPDWTENGRLRPAPALTRFHSIRAVARSLGRPVETIRRHARALVEAGVCVATDEGLAVSNDVATAGRVLAYLAALHDVLLRMIEDLHATMPLESVCPPGVDLSAARVVETALDINLMPFEVLRDRFDDWTAMIVWSMIGTANTRGVLLDPILNRRYAVEPSPDALRRPVSLHAVARTIGIPYATAWRHADRLHAAGQLTRHDDGWLLTQGNLHEPAVEAAVQEVTRYYLRRIEALVRSGLAPADTGLRYIKGRPPLVEI